MRVQHNAAKLVLTFAASAVCLIGASSEAIAAVNYSPVGPVWDCSISGGGQKGLAFISFNDDGTFTGYQILTYLPKSPTKTDPTYGRTPQEEATRGSSSTRGGSSGSDNGGSTATPAIRTNLFGFAQMIGPWRYDLKGRVVGFYTVNVDADTASDNTVTHGIGYQAKVSPGKRITLIASTPTGTVTYSGIPAKDMPDLSGAWYATKARNKQKLQEFFTLGSFALDNPWAEAFPDLTTFPNVYFTSDGQGPGYSFIGIAMFSVRKQVGFVFNTTADGSTNGVLSSTFGAAAVKKTYIKVSSNGVEEPAVPINYTALLTSE